MSARRLTIAVLVAAVLLAALLLVACQRDSVPGGALTEGNRLYDDGLYAEAADAYEYLVTSGVRDGTLFFNLGNAYYKQADTGRAITNYLRAQRLLPRDNDVTANLALARSQAPDELEGEAINGLVAWVRQALLGWSTLEESATAALVLWVVLCLAVLALVVTRGARAWRYLVGVLAALAMMAVLSAGGHWWVERGQAQAIVVDGAVQVRSGPGPDYLQEFALHAGAELRVLDRQNGWLRIALPGHLQGWVPAESVEVVSLSP